jgi:threonyl-tRNA synthetase
VQVVGIPVHSDYEGYLQDVAARLRSAGVRVEVDGSDDRMQKKIRNAQKSKVPFMLIVGEDDVSKDAVSFRFRDGTQENGVPVDDAVARLVAAVQPGAPEGTA